MTIEEALKKYQQIQKASEEGEDFDNSILFDIVESLFYFLNINPKSNNL